jgi:glutamyl-tRNA synthetase
VPRFWHMPLLRNLDKSKISKRKNPVSLIYYRESGFLPEAMINFLGLMGGGMAQPTEQEIVSKGLNVKEGDIFSLVEMLAKFDFERISLGGPVFDLTKLKWLNGEYLRALAPDDFFAALRSTIFSDDYLRRIAPLVQTRIETLSQFGDMSDFFFKDDVMPAPEVFLPKKRSLEETVAFATEQLAVLETTDFAVAPLEVALKQLGLEKEWPVKDNFMLLRAIVTGRTASPPLLESLIVFGKARSLDRVRRFVDAQKRLASQKK